MCLVRWRPLEAVVITVAAKEDVRLGGGRGRMVRSNKHWTFLQQTVAHHLVSCDHAANDGRRTRSVGLHPSAFT